MEYRYLVLGVNLILASVLVLIYGLVNAEPRIIGVAISIGLMGSVATVLGFSSAEPSAELLRMHSMIVEKAVVKLLEDLDLLNSNPLMVTAEGVQYLIYCRNTVPKEFVPGVGVNKGMPYLAIEVSLSLGDVELQMSVANEPDIEAVLHRILIENYGVASRLITSAEDGIFSLEFRGVAPLLKESLKTPCNMLIIASLSLLNKLLKKPVVLRETRLLDDRYVLKIGVAEGGG